jgi:predicted Rossmann fold nucleotide-binding protein DprA/Smf involved in DNA uptake
LGDPQRRVLTVPQLRTLAKRARLLEKADRELTEDDLISVGYDRTMAARMIELLESTEQLNWYVKKGERVACVPVTRVSPMYPETLKQRLGWDCPGCLWAKGDLSLLAKPAVALVGSRDLRPENRRFAVEAGRQAARQGFVLVSGNARGADKAAQDACLAAGGQVISVVADSLESHPLQPNVLYLSEDGFDLPFSPQRALSRNRVIHALGTRTLVAQCDLGKGGTWDGTVKNLRRGDSPVFCFCDGSQAMTELADLGARLIPEKALENLDALLPDELNFMDR